MWRCVWLGCRGSHNGVQWSHGKLVDFIFCHFSSSRWKTCLFRNVPPALGLKTSHKFYNSRRRLQFFVPFLFSINSGTLSLKISPELCINVSNYFLVTWSLTTLNNIFFWRDNCIQWQVKGNNYSRFSSLFCLFTILSLVQDIGALNNNNKKNWVNVWIN